MQHYRWPCKSIGNTPDSKAMDQRGGFLRFWDEECNPAARERLQRIFNPELLQFSMTFDITDARIINLPCAWIMKHFCL